MSELTSSGVAAFSASDGASVSDGDSVSSVTEGATVSGAGVGCVVAAGSSASPPSVASADGESSAVESCVCAWGPEVGSSACATAEGAMESIVISSTTVAMNANATRSGPDHPLPTARLPAISLFIVILKRRYLHGYELRRLAGHLEGTRPPKNWSPILPLDNNISCQFTGQWKALARALT